MTGLLWRASDGALLLVTLGPQKRPQYGSYVICGPTLGTWEAQKGSLLITLGQQVQPWHVVPCL